MAFGYSNFGNDTQGGSDNGSYANEEGVAKSSIIREASATALKDTIISPNAEASFAMGVQDMGTQQAIDASVGVGASKEEVAQSSADFAREADRAIREGQSLDHVRYNDPNLSQAAQAQIYDQVARTHNTSNEEIEKREAEASKEDMAAVQGAVLGGTGLLAALDSMSGNPLKAEAPEKAQANHPLAGLLSGFDGPKLAFADMGPTSQFLADHDNIQSGLTVGPEQRSREAAVGV